MWLCLVDVVVICERDGKDSCTEDVTARSDLQSKYCWQDDDDEKWETCPLFRRSHTRRQADESSGEACLDLRGSKFHMARALVTRFEASNIVNHLD